LDEEAPLARGLFRLYDFFFVRLLVLRPVERFAVDPLRLDVLRDVPERDDVERDREVPEVERARDVPEVEPEREREVPEVEPEREREVPDVERDEVPLFAVRDFEVPEVERARDVPEVEPERERDVPEVEPEREREVPDVEPEREREVPDVEPEREREVPDVERDVDFVPVRLVVDRFAVVDPLRPVPVRDELRDVPDVDRERLVDPEPDRERLLVGDFGGVAARARETPSSVVGSPPTFSSSTRSGSALKPAYGSDPSWVLYSSK
jgi:hypothetical protein